MPAPALRMIATIAPTAAQPRNRARMLRRTTLPVLAGLIGLIGPASQAAPASARDVDAGATGAAATERAVGGAGQPQGIGTIRTVAPDARPNAEPISEEIAHAGRAGEPAGRDAGDAAAAAAANQRGEAAYHDGDLAAAVALYQQAIELDPGYALSYSNLGLAYVRLGRATEAIWASRRAIALARGAGAATIRAGAYYNIGKLYEEDGEYERAMSHYLAARREKPDKTYDQALERVSGY